MVTKYGMSSLGPIVYGGENQEVFLGKDYGHVKNYSESSAAKIDALINELLETAHKRTHKIITENKKLMIKISEDLIKEETINSEEFLKYFKNTKVPKKATV